MKGHIMRQTLIAALCGVAVAVAFVVSGWRIGSRGEMTRVRSLTTEAVLYAFVCESLKIRWEIGDPDAAVYEAHYQTIFDRLGVQPCQKESDP